MHLALVTHNVIPGDGQGRVNVALVQHLLAQGIDVTLIAHSVDPALVEAGAEWLRLDTGCRGEAVDLVKVWRFRRQADRLVRRTGDRFDAILACGVTLNVPHTVNAVHFAHGGWRRSPYHAAKVNPGLNGAYQWLFSALNDRWERQTLAKAQRIVAVSEMVKQELMKSGLPAEKIDVIVNGVDLEEFHPGPADRTALELPEGVPLGLFVGDIRSSIKNPDGVVRALVEAPEAHLAVAGALEGSPLPALARQVGVEERVHFLGFRRDVAELMRAADFFVLPSRRDSCPLVLLEAMASGLPVITSRQVGTANLVTEDAGFVLDDPADTGQLAAFVRSLATQPERREAMGHVSRLVAERHSWDRMARQYQDVLLQVVRSPLLNSV